MTTMVLPFPPRRMTAEARREPAMQASANQPAPPERYGQSEAHAARRRELLRRVLRG